MAERRMFSKQITETDAFLDMPFSAQLLYFHLCMYADDDGFVSSPKKIQRMIGCTGEDMNVLASKHFTIPFNSGVLAIKHWKINNQIQKDRYHPTKYEEEKSALIEKPNGAYTLVPDKESVVSSLYTRCIQDESKMETEVSIDKDSIDKDSKTYMLTDGERDSSLSPSALEKEFKILWSIYPRKKGNKQLALRDYMKARKNGTTYKEVEDGIYALIAYSKAMKTDDQFIPYGSTFFHGHRWEDDYTIRKEPTLNDIAPAIDSSIIFEE